MILKIGKVTVAYAGTQKTSYEAGRICARIMYEQLLKRKEELEKLESANVPVQGSTLRRTKKPRRGNSPDKGC